MERCETRGLALADVSRRGLRSVAGDDVFGSDDDFHPEPAAILPEHLVLAGAENDERGVNASTAELLSSGDGSFQVVLRSPREAGEALGVAQAAGPAVNAEDAPPGSIRVRGAGWAESAMELLVTRQASHAIQDGKLQPAVGQQVHALLNGSACGRAEQAVSLAIRAAEQTGLDCGSEELASGLGAVAGRRQRLGQEVA
jgi:hypothetical protein